MRPGPGYAGEPLPINLGADMTRATGSKRGCSRQTMQQLPVVPIAANGNEPGGKAKPAATSTPAAAAQPTKKQRKRKKAASVAGDQGIVVDLSRFKAATTAIMKQYTGQLCAFPAVSSRASLLAIGLRQLAPSRTSSRLCGCTFQESPHSGALQRSWPS